MLVISNCSFISLTTTGDGRGLELVELGTVFLEARIDFQ